MAKYKITLTENQLRVVMLSLEDYFRTRTGQYFDLSEDLAFNGFNYGGKKDDKWKKDFYDRIDRRNRCERVLREAHRIAQPMLTSDDYYRSTPDMITALDVWHVIRHQRWKDNPNHSDCTVDAYPPYPESDEPLAKIEKVEQDE